ncbi:MAG TPA: hypothetical protein VHE55_10700 [Fimbriimonadaceae bacterium]|nr:hypothetical protein [Fimbriimonadaceae bacterium]
MSDAPKPTAVRICASCGKKLSDSEIRCPLCGQGSRAGQSKAPKPASGCAIVGLVLLLFLLAAASSCALSIGSNMFAFRDIGLFFVIASLAGIVAIVIHLLNRRSSNS